MKRNLLFLLSTFLLVGAPLTSCGNEHKNQDEVVNPGDDNNKPGEGGEGEGETNPDNPDNPGGEGETNPDNPDNPGEGEGETNPDNPDNPGGEGETNPDNPDNPDNPGGEGDTNPDNPDEPVEDTIFELKTATEAYALAEKYPVNEKGYFDKTVGISIKGRLIDIYDIKNGIKFAVIMDETGIFPALVNHQSLDTKYHVGNYYEIKGFVGNLQGMKCIEVKVNENPKLIEDLGYTFDNLYTEKNIDDVYTEAYKLKMTKGGEALDNKLIKITATYVKKIGKNGDLFMVFDGQKHVILHGEDKFTNGMSEGSKYEFIVIPCAFNFIRRAEVVNKKLLPAEQKDVNYLDEIKTVAKQTTVKDLYNIDEKDEKGKVYPFIFNINAYVQSNLINSKDNLAFTDKLEDDVKYSKTNERPKAIYIRNHVVDSYNQVYSNLYPYYLSEAKVDTYFVMTHYDTQKHAYSCFVLDNFTPEYVIQ